MKVDVASGRKEVWKEFLPPAPRWRGWVMDRSSDESPLEASSP